MKTGESHEVPLSGAALDVLARADSYSDDGLVFPSSRGKVMTSGKLSEILKELEIPGTVHGLRSTFVDWQAEHGVPRDVRESSLAHKVPGTEGAYFRSTLLERRRKVMQAWGYQVAGENAGMPDGVRAALIEVADVLEGATVTA